MMILQWIIVGVMVSLCLLTIVQALPWTKELLPLSELVTRFIPSWTFFAPNPGINEFYLVYRDYDKNGEVSDWKDTPDFHDERSLTHTFWHPKKRPVKALVDLVVSLMKIHSDIPKDAEYKEERLKVTIPYLHLLNYIINLPKEGNQKYRQFAVLDKSIIQEYHVLFVSDAHPFEN